MGKLGLKGRLLLFIDNQGISVREFERRCGLSNGYVRGIRQGVTAEKVEQIATQFPTLSKSWLLTGEGDMLLPRTSQTATGNGNVQVAGNGNSLGTDAMDELKAQLAKKDEQIERLLAIIDKLTNG